MLQVYTTYVVCSQYLMIVYREYCEYSQHFEVPHCGYFRTRSISGFDTVDSPCTSSIAGFCTAGTANTTGLEVFRVLQALAVFRPLWYCSCCE